MPSEPELTLKLEPQELASTVEALHDAIIRRLSWSVLAQYKEWRRLPIADLQTILDSMVSSYGKGLMAFNTAGFKKNADYVSTFSLPEEMWDLLHAVTMAKSWDDIPFHDRHDGKSCGICYKMEG